MLSLALFGPDKIPVIAFPLVGLFASVMWPILISLALNSVAEYHGSFTGILGTAIMGGAVMPVIIGRIGDHLGLRNGLALLYLTFGFIFSVGFWAQAAGQQRDSTAQRGRPFDGGVKRKTGF